MKRFIVLLIITIFFLLIQNISWSAQNFSANEEKVDYIKISIRQCKLWAFKRLGDNSLKLVREYKVCTAKETLVRQGKCPMGLGYITKIDTKPSWTPTNYTRWHLARRYSIHLPNGTIPYGHPLNYMGSFKIDLSHSVRGKGSVFRIHGVMRKTANSIGSRESGGCVRMHNEDGLELCRLVSVGTPVEIIL